MNSFITSLIRTNVPVAVGALIAWLISLGVDVPAGSEDGLIIGLTALLIAIYYTVVRALEKRWAGFGFLLGTRQEPSYPTGDGTGRYYANPDGTGEYL